MTTATALPSIIQGGMGIGVSNWRLARAVSLRGQLGVVSGTLVDTVLVRRLQDGDAGGHMRRAMEQFPLPGVAAAVLRRYFRPRGRPGTPYAMLPMYRQGVAQGREQITMLANFVEVLLAREGHDGPVGLNLLTKLQLPTLAALYGAMLAGVGYVLMGAGIPREIPAVLDAFAERRPASLRLDVEGVSPDRGERMTLDPAAYWDGSPPSLQRPAFLAIIASNSLATMLARKASGRVDGFVIEGPTAGGHNAPPRGAPQFNERGEPLYGERDEVDPERIRELGLPFWLAGGTGSPAALRQARARGAAGIQVGTLFGYAEESGIAEDLKRSVLAHAARGAVDVFTDPLASPTGYPFKVVRWPADPVASAPELRSRVCDLGGLRVPYVRPDGRLGYRCPAEPVAPYLEKGGLVEDTVGRRCLCNALMANIGHPQVRAGGRVEPPLLTSGDDLTNIGRFLKGRTTYTAADVLDYLLSGVDA
jgi:NAD(P)H-dependent flavin oxidoreductase YrpB (nitropropane dioxygenase family)